MLPSANRPEASGPRRVPSPGGVASASTIQGSSRAAGGEGSGRKLDIGVLIGAVVAVLGILVGLLLEGGSLGQVLQPTAAIIVLGGTCGAVLVQFPLATVRESCASVRELLSTAAAERAWQMQELVQYAAKARRRGLVSLDADLAQVGDAFTRRCLTLAVDGVAAGEIAEIMEQECVRREDAEDQMVRIWEAAGGFAPTMGILGAVLGLIRVMQQLDNMHQVGQGIAVAFVATLYGVGSANLVFLPVAGRLRLRMQARQQARAMTLDAVLLIVDGASPRALRERMSAYSDAAVPPAAPERVAG